MYLRFLLAKLYMEALTEQASARNVRECLKSLPQDLDAMYELTLQRIESQGKGQAALADQILTWLSCAPNPLELHELLEALAIHEYDQHLTSDDIPSIDRMLSACWGLVMVEGEYIKSVRLIHYTTREYFSKWGLYSSRKHHGYITCMLMTYLDICYPEHYPQYYFAATEDEAYGFMWDEAHEEMPDGGPKFPLIPYTFSTLGLHIGQILHASDDSPPTSVAMCTQRSVKETERNLKWYLRRLSRDSAFAAAVDGIIRNACAWTNDKGIALEKSTYPTALQAAVMIGR